MMKKKGFTLIELLVVMAIIAILASIVVPNVQRYIVRARLTRGIAEISGMDMSLTAIVTDAGRGNLSQMLHRDTAQDERIGWPTITDNPNAFDFHLFENAAQVYSRIAYDLLRMGRDSLRSDTDTIAQEFIHPDVLSQIGTSYMDIALDPWGNTYRIWPGPWRYSREGIDVANPPMINGREVRRWPIPFRIFAVEMGQDSFAVQEDAFVLTQQDIINMGIAEDGETWPSRVGFPADGNKSVFIWSMGQNNRSSQMLYRGEYSADYFSWYYTDSGEDLAGGDDINNWDAGASWQRFYM